jgi:cytochrome c peroxidase
VKANAFRLSGLETQAIAGTKVHRLKMAGSILESHPRYKRLFGKAFPRGVEGIPVNSEVDDAWLGAALAIAAYERTVLANRAPFQKWLYGNRKAMSRKELRGGILFFGKAQCVECHTGPALSSKPGASEDEIFFNIGFNHLNTADPRVHGKIDTNTRRGRGGFTGRPGDRFKFKVPQLYNLKDANVLGHGASFTSVREVIVYKNIAAAQSGETTNLAAAFTELDLSETEINDLTAFVEDALYDKRLFRYVPRRLPSGSCFPDADYKSTLDLGCF